MTWAWRLFGRIIAIHAGTDVRPGDIRVWGVTVTVGPGTVEMKPTRRDKHDAGGG